MINLKIETCVMSNFDALGILPYWKIIPYDHTI